MRFLTLLVAAHAMVALSVGEASGQSRLRLGPVRSAAWAGPGETPNVGHPAREAVALDRTASGLVWGGVSGVVFGAGVYTLWVSDAEGAWRTGPFIEAALLGAAIGASIGALLVGL